MPKIILVILESHYSVCCPSPGTGNGVDESWLDLVNECELQDWLYQIILNMIT